MALRDNSPVGRIGLMIEAEARRRGWEQKDLVSFFGVTQATVSRWLTGESTPKDLHVSRLAEYLGEPVEPVLRAIHEQRKTDRAALERRVDSLESVVAQLTQTVDRLASLLEVRPSDQPSADTRSKRARAGRDGQ